MLIPNSKHESLEHRMKIELSESKEAFDQLSEDASAHVDPTRANSQQIEPLNAQLVQ